MSAVLIPAASERDEIAIEAVTAETLDAIRARLPAAQRQWLADCGFTAAPGRWIGLPDAQGRLERVLVGVDRREPFAALAELPQALPIGRYRLDEAGVPLELRLAALGWALGAYRFRLYRKPSREPAALALPAELLGQLAPLVDASYLVRDLVNTPTEELGPAELALDIERLADMHQARVRTWVGDDLLAAGFPAIHAVGRASHRPPRLIELSWGEEADPGLVIVGKGVCFDTGGLDLKSADGMRNMKKDMGGAAHAIALAALVMHARLPVRLSLLVPAVENAIGPQALRPGDVIATRAGFRVEIDNTDAEGRLILADALAYGAEQRPDLLIDIATLTGAARVALGPDLPALFSREDALAERLVAIGRAQADPLWRLPLWQPYRRLFDSQVADFANGGPSRHAGAIVAALYLERFVPAEVPWLHLDTYAWNDTDRPGRPRGGEAQGLRALFALLEERYG
ncbi:MAG: leucyl aminopeptidase family protein [Fulvimonas sp.]|nr:leucyl aminopeptidase family protein [Fulvimonas sp.]